MLDRIACRKFKRLNESFLDGNAILVECVDDHGRHTQAVCSVHVYDHEDHGEVTEMMPLAVLVDGGGWQMPEPEEVFPVAQA
jgi:hypothetical protein